VHAANWALPESFDPIFERALAKDPATRYPHASEFVGELRGALHDDAGDTGWIQPVAATATAAPTRVAPPAARNRPWLVPILVVALIAGGVLAALLATRDSKTAAPTRARTIITTVTGPGQTVRQTVTAATPPAPTTTAGTSGGSGSQLNNDGYAKMRQGDYAGALPLLEQAVQKLSGSGSTDEAYADYNLAYTRRALGQCTDVLGLLDRSQAIQGHRKEIDRLRKDAQKRCG
jgi:tetratricopeptide (TPR) repeat protein